MSLSVAKRFNVVIQLFRSGINARLINEGCARAWTPPAPRPSRSIDIAKDFPRCFLVLKSTEADLMGYYRLKTFAKLKCFCEKSLSCTSTWYVCLFNLRK